MKRKILALIIALVASVNIANAQLFVGGTAGFAYQREAFSAAVEPMVGYQFYERWAVGSGLGIQIYANDGTSTAFMVNPFGRLNLWNNSKYYFDLKAEATFGFQSDFTYKEFCITPSFRMNLSRKWQLAADFAVLGFEDYGDGLKPEIGCTAKGVSVSVIYKFW